MTIDNIKDLKDKIYEIEGLLELAQLREDKIPELEPLILGRIKSLLEEDDSEAAEEAYVPVTEVTESESPAVNSISELFEETEMKSVSRTVEELDIPELQVSREIQTPEHVSREEKKSETEEVKRHKLDKPAFCLNDRFRFKRELFGNSDAAFSSAMNMIAAMDSYDEAEEYFIGELEWDAENPEVVDFMEIIKGYFEV